MKAQRQMARVAWLALVAAAAPGTPPVYAQHEHRHPTATAAAPTAPHGGTLIAADGQRFEAVFARDGVTLYPLTADLKPVDASALAGKVTFFHPNAPGRAWFEKDLAPTTAAPGQTADALGLKVNLATAPATGTKAVFDIQGPSKPVRLEVPVTFAATSAALTVAPATAADKPALDAQKRCPVSGEDLMAMGAPVKVSRGERAVYLCCKSCLKAVQADPAKFLAGGTPPAAGHAHHH
jgi:hypothetical protein